MAKGGGYSPFPLDIDGKSQWALTQEDEPPPRLIVAPFDPQLAPQEQAVLM